MTDQRPERIWVYAEKLGWRAEIAATDKKARDNQSEYLRTDTAVTKSEADAMVATVVEKIALRLEVEWSLLAANMARSHTPADARAAFERAVREAVEAEKERCAKEADKVVTAFNYLMEKTKDPETFWRREEKRDIAANIAAAIRKDPSE